MTVIEIHLDGKPVTKLEAARALAKVMGEPVSIGEPNEDGWISRHGITVHARWPRYGKVAPPQVSWPSIGSRDAADAREFAGMITLAVEIAELAEMLAAEQAGA